jgi:hypothetical protein
MVYYQILQKVVTLAMVRKTSIFQNDLFLVRKYISLQNVCGLYEASQCTAQYSLSCYVMNSLVQ